MKYVITGATGNTGKRITIALLSAGHKVVAVSRDEAHLRSLVEEGATPAVGTLEDADFLAETFQGAQAIYALIPPNFQAPDFRAYQQSVAQAIVSGLRHSGVSHVVTLSSFGAHRPDTGVVSGLYDFEQLLAESLPSLHVLHLRAGFFMENFFGMIPAVQHAGVLGGFPLPPNQPTAVVHTQDIAQMATDRLLKLDFSGQGHVAAAHSKDYTLTEAAAILGAAIGQPDLAYVQFSDDQFRSGMLQMGAKDSIIDGYITFGKAVANGALNEGTDRDLTQGTPTSLESFASVWAEAYWHATAVQG